MTRHRSRPTRETLRVPVVWWLLGLLIRGHRGLGSSCSSPRCGSLSAARLVSCRPGRGGDWLRTASRGPGRRPASAPVGRCCPGPRRARRRRWTRDDAPTGSASDADARAFLVSRLLSRVRSRSRSPTSSTDAVLARLDPPAPRARRRTCRRTCKTRPRADTDCCQRRGAVVAKPSRQRKADKKDREAEGQEHLEDARHRRRGRRRDRHHQGARRDLEDRHRARSRRPSPENPEIAGREALPGPR